MNDKPVFHVCIDHDVPFVLADIEYLAYCIRLLPQSPDEAYVRESTGGNTHVKLVYNRGIMPIQALFVRAIMRDDSRRLRADMQRFIRCEREIDYCFSEKIDVDTGEIKKAGDWVRLKL